MTRSGIDHELAKVVKADLCSGCGACCLLDDGLEMRLVGGFNRPVRVSESPSEAAGQRAREFVRICPGRSVRAPARSAASLHPILGNYLGVWSAYARDPEVRRAGASGGVLTALTAWFAETGEHARVTGSAAGSDPRRTVSVSITSRAEALSAAGSRYAPVSNAADPGVRDVDSAFIGKPCEVAALRAMQGQGDSPLLLSFFCAGTPSQSATDNLVRDLGADSEHLLSLRYRGDGWPGRFAVSDATTTRSMSYDESWGTHLGPTVQWRCKLCPDGMGESADIVAGDFWEVDEHGYPRFEEGEGRSALVARTARGLDVVRRAVGANVIGVDPILPDDVVAVQPLQHERRTNLLGRLIGCLAAGRRVPRYRGFGLVRLARSNRRQTWRAARGTRRRAWVRGKT